MFIKTHYSVLESSLTVETAVQKLKELGYKIAVLADNQLFGSLEFFYACQKAEIMPVIACEYSNDNVTYLLVAKNGEGFKDLSKIVSTDTLFDSDNIFKVLIDFEKPADLKGVKVDYIGISNKSGVKEVFKANTLRVFAEKTKTPVIPYDPWDHAEKDFRSTRALVAIGTESNLDELFVDNKEAFIKDKTEYMGSIDKEELKNLSTMLKACSVEGYNFGNPTPPHFQFKAELATQQGLPTDIAEEDLFAHMARVGLEKRLASIPTEKHAKYKERLEYEINIINQMKFPGYMLIVQDFVLAAKNRGIPVGPGRGSAAGSLVAYAMEITDIDPIPYGLLFERFLNPERVTMPDIDMDFCQSRRQEVIDFVIERYGKEQVAQIVTFGTLAARGVIRDVSRILGYPLFAADKFAKIIPEKPGITLEKAYKAEKEKIDKVLENPEAKRVWKYAQKLEGRIRNLGVHAAGLVITDTPVYEKCPLTNVNGTQVVQFEGKYLEDVDLIKFDFLGLKTLSVIHEAVEMIKKNHNIDIKFPADYNDPKVYDMISTGNTLGVFQIESDGMQKLCKRMQPNRFEDIVALLALYRPGPMESGMLEDFVARKRGEKEVKYFFEDFEEILKPILEPTYGVIVYQEQVMKIVQEIGGFSLGEADIIRRAMGKKDIKYMEQKAAEFADGAVKKGLNRDHAVELFGLIEKFAGYGFNKSHSAAYAVLTFQTAYLKTYYPHEFLTALLNFDMKDQDKISKYINEAQRMGIKINKTDINTSPEYFETDGDSISYGLRAIKGVGVGAEPCIIAREEKPFENFVDFVTRTRTGKKKMNKRVFEALAVVGALDSFGISRRAMIENSKELLDLKKPEVFDLIKEVGDFSLSEKIKLEKDKTGVYMTDPFDPVRSYIDPYKIPNLNELSVGSNYILVFPESVVERTAKKTGKKFSILTGYYNKQTIDVLAFNNAADQLRSANTEKPLVLKVNVKEDGGCFLNAVYDFKKSTLESFFLKA